MRYWAFRILNEAPAKISPKFYLLKSFRHVLKPLLFNILDKSFGRDHRQRGLNYILTVRVRATQDLVVVEASFVTV